MRPHIWQLKSPSFFFLFFCRSFALRSRSSSSSTPPYTRRQHVNQPRSPNRSFRIYPGHRNRLTSIAIAKKGYLLNERGLSASPGVDGKKASSIDSTVDICRQLTTYYHSAYCILKIFANVRRIHLTDSRLDGCPTVDSPGLAFQTFFWGEGEVNIQFESLDESLSETRVCCSYLLLLLLLRPLSGVSFVVFEVFLLGRAFVVIAAALVALRLSIVLPGPPTSDKRRGRTRFVKTRIAKGIATG
eukprot:1189626-Prorocentrum_minimum.AAC.7